jgi:AraC-like DNA-binding protein
MPEQQNGTAAYSTLSEIRSIGIQIAPWLIDDFLQEEDLYDAGVSEIIEKGRRERFLHHPLPFSPLINMRLHEILGCPYEGSLRRLFLEGKSLELIALSLSQLATDRASGPGTLENFSGPPDFIQDARDILIGNLQNPPSLSTLSKKVGVNRNKLCCCFREAYGTTVFDYLRTVRLEKSKKLLESGGKSVTEVAFEVGYAQQSNFTKEFTKYFGACPRRFLR